MLQNKKFLILLAFFIVTFFILSGYIMAAEMTDNIKKGLQKLSMNKLDDARSYFEREMASNPKNGLAYYYSGEVYYRKGDFSKAIETYQKAIEIEPENPSYKLGLGIAYLAAGQTDKAIEELQAVVSAAGQRYEGKEAEILLAKIKDDKRDKDTITKWQDLEKNVQKPVEEKKTEAAQPEMPQTQKVSVEALVKEVRFGTDTKRKEASQMLYNLIPSQLEPFLPQFIAQIDKEKNDEVKKNLLLIIGKTQTKEAVDFLFGILENPTVLFDTKMVALQGLSETLSPDAAERLKDVLDKMVSTKLKMRENARKKIDEIDKKIDDIESQKYVIKNDITKLRVERQKIYDKLNLQPEAEAGGPVPPEVAPPGAAPPERPVETLSPEQIRQLRAQLRTIENDINKNEARITRLDKQIENLKAEKAKQEQILVKRYSTGTVKVLGITRTADEQPAQEQTPGVPMEPMPGMGMPAVQAGEEQVQEQSLALSIIKILGRIGKPEHLTVIEKAWEEYEASSFELDYGLVRAQLGSYEYIEKLVERLQQDYPAQDMNEIYFRADIVKVIGTYLSKHENQDYAELLAYLAESAPYQVIKIAANQALSKIKTKETEKTGKQT